MFFIQVTLQNPALYDFGDFSILRLVTQRVENSFSDTYLKNLKAL